jgi:hypothetical protein
MKKGKRRKASLAEQVLSLTRRFEELERQVSALALTARLDSLQARIARLEERA